MYIEWEYTDVTCKSLHRHEELERLGNGGWECYAVTNEGTDGEYKMYHFKRKKFGENQ